MSALDLVLAEHADGVSQYRAGKTAAFGFLVGRITKAAAGKANPKRVNELLKHTLEERYESRDVPHESTRTDLSGPLGGND